MREGSVRGPEGWTPPRGGILGDQKRTSIDPHRDTIFGSPPFRRDGPPSFRAFSPPSHEPQQQHHHHHHHHHHSANGYGAPVRPNSQPVEPADSRRVENIARLDGPFESRGGSFHQYDDRPTSSKNDTFMRHEPSTFQNGVTSQSQERSAFGSPLRDRDGRGQDSTRFPLSSFGPPMREDQASLFRPIPFQATSHPGPETASESIEARSRDFRRQLSGPSHTLPGASIYDRERQTYMDRPMTLENHQRMERTRSDPYGGSDTSMQRVLLNISPDLNRKGRHSPLPQAVQGAQPRHVGPAGDNPGIKIEFGRMFSGLGAGVGSATPNAGQSANGVTTPLRQSPTKNADGMDSARHTIVEMESGRGGLKSGSRGGRKPGRRPREEEERIDVDERNTPDSERAAKRAKPTHHHHHVRPHHHHHHHHEPTEPAPGTFNMIRFPSNPLVHANPAHHHHHHHAHPGHHHHHPPRPVPIPRKSTLTVHNRKVIDECAAKPRSHLGSRLYTTDISLPPATDTPLSSKIKFRSSMHPIPVFEGKENCTFTIRVPRYFLTPSTSGSYSSSPLEEVCKHRQIWGTDIYTDDSDVMAAAVHSGWLKGDFGELNEDLRDVDAELDQDGVVVGGGGGGAEEDPNSPSSLLPLTAPPKKPIRAPKGYDAHVTLLILPPLQSYATSNRHHLWSREWKKPHDGMSYMIHRIDFVNEGLASRFTERGAEARKARIAAEEAKRREAATSLLMFANGRETVVGGGGVVRVGA